MSALPNDGTFPTGTTQFEKRNLATEVPVWDPEVCIQCGKCVLVCPHAVIRSKVYEPRMLWPARRRLSNRTTRATAGMERSAIHAPGRGRGLHRLRHLRRCLPGAQQIRSATEGDQHAAATAAARKRARELGFFPRDSRVGSHANFKRQRASAAGQQPLFEFSGACAGCGETPYIKLLTQLFGDRLVIANATGCSSIYGGNLPTTPYTRRSTRAAARPGRIRYSKTTPSSGSASASRSTSSRSSPANCSSSFRRRSDDDLATEILNARQRDEADICEQRARVAESEAKARSR